MLRFSHPRQRKKSQALPQNLPALLNPLIGLIWAFGLLFLSPQASACEFTQTEKACLHIAADKSGYEPGSAIRLAAIVEVQDGWHVNSNQPSFEYLIPTEVQWETPADWDAPSLRYPLGKMQTFAFSGQPISVYDGVFKLIATWTTPTSVSDPVEVKALLRYQACTDDRCLPPINTNASLTVSFGTEGNAINVAHFADNEPSMAAPASLWLMLVFGLIGGLILNAMPCVLPVLSLKIFSLSKSAGEDRGAVVTGALATTAGILFSFWALAVLAISLRAGGTSVGWGIQFQEPMFVAALVVIVLIFSLNLWGVFEINLPGWLSPAGGGAPVEGVAGDFTTGLFTTLMATPCTAPFLGTAVGFALAQSAFGMLAIFTAIGIGMASPYLLLAVAPRAAKILPKPGQWMVQLKIVLGFALVAALVWLLYVLGNQLGAEALAFVQLALLSVALFVWATGQAKTTAVKSITRVAAIASIAAVLGLAHDTRDAVERMDTSSPSGIINWLPFDESQAQTLAAAGNKVFIDVTADWCFTCKVNKTLVLNRESVEEAFVANNVVAMRADWTHPDARISRFLSSFGRAGIPFYVLYRPDGTTHVFGEILTTHAIIDALSP